MFIAQLDGEVAYQMSDQNIEFYYILVENVDHKLAAVRFSPDQTAGKLVYKLELLKRSFKF